MSKKQVIILLIFIIFVFFLLLKPYNQLCRGTNLCQPISFSYLMPGLKGEKLVNFTFNTQNDHKNIEFRVLGEKSVLLRSGSKYTVDYEVINNSKDDIEVRPMRFFSNNKIMDYLHFYECLCFESHKIMAGEKRTMSMRFQLKNNIDDNNLFKNKSKIEIGYKLIVE